MSIPSLKEYCRPQTVADVVELLGRYGESGLIVAGATFIHGLEARGLLMGVEALIDIGGTGLSGVAQVERGLQLGATLNFATLERLPQITGNAAYGAIADAMVYPPLQIKNAATIGGCVAASLPFFDLPAALMALDAEVEVRSSNSSRCNPLPELFVGLFENSLAPDEFITGLIIPEPPANTVTAFMKLETNANDLAIVNAAVRLTLDRAGNCREARVVLGGGVSDRFVRSELAERVLIGNAPSDELFLAASEAVVDDISPMADHRASAEYREAMAKLFLRRTLQRAGQRIGYGTRS